MTSQARTVQLEPKVKSDIPSTFKIRYIYIIIDKYWKIYISSFFYNVFYFRYRNIFNTVQLYKKNQTTDLSRLISLRISMARIRLDGNTSMWDAYMCLCVMIRSLTRWQFDRFDFFVLNICECIEDWICMGGRGNTHEISNWTVREVQLKRTGLII